MRKEIESWVWWKLQLSPALFLTCYFTAKVLFFSPQLILSIDLSCVFFEIHDVERAFPNYADSGSGQVTGHRRNHHVHGKG